MKRHRLSDMVRGWFIGPFEPTLLPTEAFECAVQTYAAGDRERPHVHRIATEFTVVLGGVVDFNGTEYGDGDIIEILPGEVAEFTALTDVTTVVVKVPAAKGDKYEC